MNDASVPMTLANAMISMQQTATAYYYSWHALLVVLQGSK